MRKPTALDNWRCERSSTDERTKIESTSSLPTTRQRGKRWSSLVLRKIISNNVSPISFTKSPRRRRSSLFTKDAPLSTEPLIPASLANNNSRSKSSD